MIFEFTKDSVVAKTWAGAVKRGEKTIEDVPNLYNLIAVVTSIIEEVKVNV